MRRGVQALTNEISVEAASDTFKEPLLCVAIGRDV